MANDAPEWYREYFASSPAGVSTTPPPDALGAQPGALLRNAPAYTGPQAGAAAAPHWGLATQAAQKHGLDPSLLAAVWDFESSGNPGAINKSSGATGLGQVMPRERGFPDRPTQAELLDPATNAEWSARILASGLQRYGSEDKALAAYLGAIDARGNITGAVDANGTGGNQYIRTVRERQQRYTGASPSAPAATQPGPTASGGAAPEWYREAVAMGAVGAAAAARTAGDLWPVSGSVITKAGQPYWSFGGGAHAGVDLQAKAGTPVRSPVSGVVVANVAAGQNPLGLSKGYGRAVAVRDEEGHVHVFGHGAPDFGYPQVGTRVGVGDVISAVGSPKTKLPGEATEGEHLHWEIRGGGDYRKQVDPERWLKDRAVPETNTPRVALTSGTGAGDTPEWYREWAASRGRT